VQVQSHSLYDRAIPTNSRLTEHQLPPMNFPSDSSTPVVIFAGGGTGGHLYPGLAIAEELRSPIGPGGAKCLFICSNRPLDARILDAAGATFVPSPAQPLSARPRGMVRFLKTWGRAVRDARGVIRAAKREAGAGKVVVVAMGGFVAAPVVQAARVERVPVMLVNLDAVPGKANRFIASRVRSRGGGGATGAGNVVSTIPVRGDVAGEWPTIGPIVRSQARATGDVATCRRSLGLDPAVPVLMVTGGSQGAKSMNALMVELAGREAALFGGWQVLHQCGKGEAEGVLQSYLGAGLERSRVVVQEFSDRMGDWWGAAELAVCRAGAGSVAEAWANRVPTVFLPYPFHKDEHQRWNAEPLAVAGAAAIEKDHVDAGKNVAQAGATIVSLMRDAARRRVMRDALEKLGAANGAAEVARRVRSLLGS
jgi:UDP-N-acetylglucosamine--N-acetylmuramyl-(pentapeptide) pyrophosphoryl-undecaprenol N-acetylglucosamine transferase